MNVQIIASDSKEIDLIAQLAHEIWQEYYPSIIGQEQVDYMLEKLYSRDALARQMQEGQQFYIITCDQKPSGFMAITSKGNHQYFLNKFYIQTRLHGKGVGKKAFQLWLENNPDAESMTLQVNRKNIGPINFYFKMGFIIHSVADFDIGDGYFMNDFIMIWKKQ